jgi:hypothetical protein
MSPFITKQKAEMWREIFAETEEEEWEKAGRYLKKLSNEKFEKLYDRVVNKKEKPYERNWGYPNMDNWLDLVMEEADRRGYKTVLEKPKGK